MNDGRTYCEHQIEAPLCTCVTCGKSYYMTVPHKQCFDCMPWKDRPTFKRKRSQADVSGNQMYE